MTPTIYSKWPGIQPGNHILAVLPTCSDTRTPCSWQWNFQHNQFELKYINTACPLHRNEETHERIGRPGPVQQAKPAKSPQPKWHYGSPAVENRKHARRQAKRGTTQHQTR